MVRPNAVVVEVKVKRNKGDFLVLEDEYKGSARQALEHLESKYANPKRTVENLFWDVMRLTEEEFEKIIVGRKEIKKVKKK